MKEIPNYNGRYLISKEGGVYSIPKGRHLKPYKSVRGYLVVNLSKKLRPIHQLVAETYLDASYKDKGLVVDHIDRVKTNNELANIRLISKADNFKNSDYYEDRKKGHIHIRPSGSYRAIITKDGVRKNKTFKTLTEAQRFLTNKH
tara:strand:- start:22 stop:456 length:435 start_codon:yes stop_codon:yes gene_type:complete